MLRIIRLTRDQQELQPFRPMDCTNKQAKRASNTRDKKKHAGTAFNQRSNIPNHLWIKGKKAALWKEMSLMSFVNVIFQSCEHRRFNELKYYVTETETPPGQIKLNLFAWLNAMSGEIIYFFPEGGGGRGGGVCSDLLPNF